MYLRLAGGPETSLQRTSGKVELRRRVSLRLAGAPEKSVQRTSGKREGRCAKVVARSTPLAEHASLIIVCVLGPNRRLVVQLREACCMQ